jgi:hypothetical protein
MFAVANALPEAVVNPADLVLSTNGTRIPGIRLFLRPPLITIRVPSAQLRMNDA